ncbi:MAG: class I SAM-dependent methyltransferase [Desulfobulbaceae bacterium]|nr:class I SAM-dependent methyltransferase [Desulfobulbaceae bacterium]
MELNNIVPWGRSFQEYREIFSLTDNDLNNNILGCGDGPASFNAELTARGGRVISADPTYNIDIVNYKKRMAAVYDEIISQLRANRDEYIWQRFLSVEELGKARMDAMELFLADYMAGREEGRYITASLPTLPFKDNQFDLALCSHYLFLYSEQVDFEQHLLAIKELCRVAREVRVYPLIALNGALSPHLRKVMVALADYGVRVSLASVGYRFQKGATEMLVASRKDFSNQLKRAKI